ncbi:MAG: type 1 glutamine amidotransferase [Candidatus Omnitrophica bacterium]|nr:type 1 glutamine amidotransferase [Candidatus Omnitrophota bacterium]
MIVIVQHISLEGAGTFEAILRSSGWETYTIDLSSHGASVLADAPAFRQDFSPDAVVVLGGPMSVYDQQEYPFLRTEEEFLIRMFRERVPVLGICLGAQLLAKACGAAVKKAPVKETGWSSVRLTEAGKRDPMFSGLRDRLKVFQLHEDTFDLPPEAVLLATGEQCAHQAARFGPCAWGVQFHPEMNLRMLKEWIEYYGLEKGEAILTDYFNAQDVYLGQARQLCANFTGIIKSRRPMTV